MTRRRRIKFWLRLISLFFLGLVVAIIIALSKVNLETLRGHVLTVLQNATGYPVQIDGVVSWKFSLRPRIELNQVRIANASWAKEKYGFASERMDVTLDLISLLRNRPTIRSVKLYDTAIRIEKNAKGESSLQPIADTTNATDETDKVNVKISRFPIPDSPFGKIEFENLLFNDDVNKFFVRGVQLRYVHTNNQREYHGWIKPRDEVYPFIISMMEYNTDRKIYPVKLALSTGGNALIANVALDGNTKIPIDFVVKGDIVDVRAVRDIFDIDLTGLPKISVNIAGGFVDKDTLELRKSSISMRGTELNISGTYDWGRKTPLVKLNVSSKNVNLVKLVPEMYSGWVRPNRELNVFHDMNLHGADIRNFDWDVNADLKHLIVYRDMDLMDTNIKITYKNTKGRVDANVGIAGGEMHVGGNFVIDETGHVYVKTGVKATDFTIGKLMQEIRINDFIVGLPMDIYGYFEANGKTMSDWMQTITGPVVAYSVADGYAYPQLVENIYGADVLTTLRHNIQDMFTEDKKHDKARISCVVANLKIRDGDIETKNGVAIETNSINARLAGDLNLGAETIDLALTTVPVRGLKLSLTGNVVNTVEIVGNLAEPDIQINGAALTGKVVSATGIGLLLMPFTGGVSFVAGLFAGGLLENWLADSEPCKTALKEGAPRIDGDPMWMNIPVQVLATKIIENKE
ncbi:MAG: AsmA family protein [Alphaproteobacteria bacterium]|nr:AsmA family protein [Alphaproteobacteria bacterium]